MQCEKFEQRLNELLDERQAPSDDAELTAHAEHCATCRRQWNAMQALGIASGHLVALSTNRVRAPSDLAARVLGELHAELRPAQRGWSALSAASASNWAALAASLLIAASFGYWAASSQMPAGNSTNNTLAKVPTPQAISEPAATPAAAERLEPYWPLPQLVQWQPVDAPSEKPLPTSQKPELTAAADPALGSPLSAFMGTSLAPVADATSAALDALWQVLPVGNEDRRS